MKEQTRRSQLGNKAIKIKLTNIESSHKRKHTNPDSCRHWRQEHIGVGPD